jgi:mannose-6-phosphate isomerase
LSDFEAFCGFKPLNKIAKLFQLDALKDFLPSSQKDGQLDNEGLREVVRTILKASADSIASAQSALTKLDRSAFGDEGYIHELLPRLQDQYDETDPGTLVALLTMNYITLPPGGALYIPADGIHAYLAGDIVECMARSNNVLNTGFCPAASRNSADLFASTLTFNPHQVDEALLPGKSWSKSEQGKTKTYSPPLAEFSVLHLDAGPNEKESWKPIDGPGVLFVTKGSGKMTSGQEERELKEGFIFFIGQGHKLEFSAGADGLQLWNAYTEPAIFDSQ